MSLSVIVSHAVRDNHVPKPEFQPTLAFDKLQQETLAFHLTSDDPRTVAAALVSLQRVLSTHLAAGAAHESGILTLLGSIARGKPADFGLPIRRDALRCVALILASPARRVATLADPDISVALRETLADPDADMRGLAASALAAGAAGLDASRALTGSGFIGALVAQLHAESSSHGHGHGGHHTHLIASGSASAAAAQLRALVAVLSQPDHDAAVAACLAAHAEDTFAQALAAAFPHASGGERGAAEAEAGKLERHCLGLRAVMPLAFDAEGREACARHPTLVRTLLALAASGQKQPAHSHPHSAAGAGGGGAAAAGVRSVDVARQALGCLMALSTSDVAKRCIADDAEGLGAIVAALRAAPDATSAVYAARAVAGLCPFPPARAGLLAARGHEAAKEAAARFPGDATVARACEAAAAAVTWAA